MGTKSPTRQLKQVKTYHGDMFKTRRPVSLENIKGDNSSPHLSPEKSFEIVGHRQSRELFDIKMKQHTVIPPITSQSISINPGLSCRPDSEPWRVSDHDQLLVQAVDRQQFLQTQGYIPGIDGQVTIKHPYVMKNGLKPLIVNAFQNDQSDNSRKTNVLPDQNSTESVHKEDKTDGTIVSDHTNELINPDYEISTFPPVGREEIVKHAKLNKEAEKRSKNKPHGYEEFLRKLKVQRRLLERQYQKRSGQKIVRQKSTKKILIKAQRETKTDLFEMKPETPPKPVITPEELRGPMKVIQSFRYSHAIAEYFKFQMDSKHSMTSFDGETVIYGGAEEVVNGWLIKTLGPQVLNMSARSIPSCNPIELRIRQQQARKRAAEHAKLSKRLSNMSRNSSRKQFRSRNSFTESYPGHESVESNRTDKSDQLTESSQSLNGKTKGRPLPNIPELFIEEGFRKPNNGRKVTNSNKTKLVLTLPALGTDA